MSQRIGSVVAINGSSLRGELDNVEEGAGASIEIGDLVRIEAPRSSAFGLVSGMSMGTANGNGKMQAYFDVDLFGEAVLNADSNECQFARGVSLFPGLRAPVFAATRDDLALIYRRPEVPSIGIGVLHQDSTVPVNLITDELLGKHFAILGSTGSGKSCAVTVILSALLKSHSNGHILLLDPHDEYTHVFGAVAEVKTAANLRLPFWFMNMEELSVILCSTDPETSLAERKILKDAVIHAKRNFVADEADRSVNADTPQPFRLNTLISFLKNEAGRLDKGEGATPCLRLLDRIESLRNDSRYSFMFGGLSIVDNMAEILSNLLRIPVEGKPLTILSLAGLPYEVVDVIVSLLARTIFSIAVWTPRDEAVPILLVCEEAHRYVPRNADTGFEPTRRAISQIAKEGRKYGVSLCLITQRPSEISETVVSQCNTLFGLRMSNTVDQSFIQGALPESSVGLLNTLPALRSQEAIVVGEAVSAPVRVRFNELPVDSRPRSATACFSAAWRDDSHGKELLDGVINRWRRQFN